MWHHNNAMLKLISKQQIQQNQIRTPSERNVNVDLQAKSITIQNPRTGKFIKLSAHGVQSNSDKDTQQNFS